MQSHKQLQKEMNVMRKENNKKFKKELEGEFDPLAFKKC